MINAPAARSRATADRVLLRHVRIGRARRGGRQPCNVDVVLDGDRHSVKRQVGAARRGKRPCLAQDLRFRSQADEDGRVVAARGCAHRCGRRCPLGWRCARVDRAKSQQRFRSPRLLVFACRPSWATPKPPSAQRTARSRATSAADCGPAWLRCSRLLRRERSKMAETSPHRAAGREDQDDAQGRVHVVFGRRPCRRRAASQGRRLSAAQHHLHVPVPGRGRHRRAHPHAGAGAAGQAQAYRDRRQPPRRRYPARQQCGREVAARRVHAAARAGDDAVDRPERVQVAAL